MREKIVLLMVVALTIFVLLSFFLPTTDEVNSRLIGSYTHLLAIAFGYIYAKKEN